MLDKVTPEVLKQVFNEVEKEVNDKLAKKKWLKVYKENYENMIMLLEARGKNGKRIH